MAKQTINVGTTANDKKGDSLRAAFTKVNANFTELYTALGLNTDGTLSLGAFEFSGSTMSTTDSTPIVIDQSVTISSDLTVSGDVVPSVANGGNLGSPAKPFKSLYVSNSTVFLGGVPLSLDQGTNELKINNVPISQTINITDVTGQSSFYKPSSILDYRTGPYYNLTSVPSGSVIIDYATYSWATGSSSSFYQSPVFRPSVYSATIDGSGNVTDIQITTAYSYPNPDIYPEFIDIENINTDNMFAIDAGIDITDPIAIAASSIFVMIDAGISSTPKPIPTDVSELTDNAGLLGQGGADTGDISFIDSDIGSETSGNFVNLDVDGEEWMRLGTSGSDKVQIITDYFGDNTKIWEFGVDGDLTLPVGGDIKDSNGDSVLGGGQGLPSITVPAVPVVLYKGLQASYGVVHSNSSSSELNVNKIVIHKPATTTSTIDPTGSNDAFQVNGLGSSDVLAMFVVYGDVNGPKPLSTLQNFTRAVIDNVILTNGEAGVYKTVDQMKSAFYGNYQILASAAGGLYTNFQFFGNNVNTLTGGATTVRQGSGATFNVTVTSEPPSGLTYNGTDIPGINKIYWNSGANQLRMSVTGDFSSGFAMVSALSAELGNGANAVFLTISGTSYKLTFDSATASFLGSGPTGGIEIGLTTTNPVWDVNPGNDTVLTITSFTLAVDGPVTSSYNVTVANGGTNYLVGHKILIDGSDLGGVTSTNDLTITVTEVNSGNITTVSFSGTATGSGTYTGATGTNIDVGSGLSVASIFKNNNVFEPSLSSTGNNYVVGDVITLLGNELNGGTTPANDITLTVTNVGGGPRGPAFTVTLSGTPPQQWPTNFISDGGQDQYDDANYINTNLANEINYNNGNTVVDGTAAFGAGSTYSFVYDTAIFGLFVTGNSATSISTSGNSGADGNSTTETGYVFGGGTPAETFDNAVTHINLVGNPYAGEAVSFTKTDNGNEVDILILDDGEGAGVGITRDGNNGIYNPYREGSWDSDVSPGGTLWNIDGWTNLTDVESRNYVPLYEAFGFGGLGNKIVGTECVMYLPDNGKYYAVKFSQWTQGGNGGGFAYTRRELDLTSLAEGIRFADGTVLKTAEGIGPVKLRSPGNRRIEEVYGYKSVLLTARQTTNLTTTASRNATDEYRIWIDTTTTTIDNILNNTTAADIWDTTTIEFSLDNVTWYKYAFNITGSGNEIGYGVTLPANNLNYNQGDAVYFRYQTGGQPQVWWDRNELPGGGSRFRGAVIDYHAFDNDAGTLVGTIHIVNDDGDENVAHTEVGSGGENTENIIVWLQDNESQLKCFRLDGEGTTIKIQWAAKIFYGSETWD